MVDQHNITASTSYCLEVNGMSYEKLGRIISGIKLCLLLMCIPSTVLQIYVMTKSVKHIRKRIGDRNLHLFLFNMTFADFLLTGWTYPNEWLLYFLDYGTVSNSYKYSMHIVAWIALSVSALSLVLLNVDKLIYFLYRLQHLNILTHCRSVLLVATTWLISGVFVSLTFLCGTFECINRRITVYINHSVDISNFEQITNFANVASTDAIQAIEFETNNTLKVIYKDCYVIAFSSAFPHGKKIYALFVFLVGIVPVISSVIVAVYIESMTRSHRKSLKEEDGLVAANVYIHRKNQTLFLRIRSFYFAFVSTVFTSVTLLPYRVFLLYKFAQDETWELNCFQLFIALIIMHVQYLNAILNPVLTVTVLPYYSIRKITRHLTYKKKARQRSVQSERSTLIYHRSCPAVSARILYTHNE